MSADNLSHPGFRSSARTAVVMASIAVISFIAGTIFQARITHPQPVQAASDRVFELMVYHALPGKATELESIFRDFSKLQAAHGLTAVGYWVPDSADPAWKDTFVYLLAHPSREAAKANWTALHSDPVFPPYRTAAAPLIQQDNGAYKVDEVFMRPTTYSAMK
jgi:NIPSNAP